MRISFCHSIISLALLLGTLACSSTPEPTEYDKIVHGTIAYPFADPNSPLGKNGPDEKFVIRSSVGAREYIIEIPGAARDYDVQVPLADIHGQGEGELAAKPDGLASPVTTDKEFVGSFPQLQKSHPGDTALLDGAFGVGDANGPQQAPSYTLGVAKIKNLFKKKNFEYALIEINNMLAFYPNSPRLHKMKGTVLLKMRNYPLAELAWIKALELKPADQVLRRALGRLQQRIIAMKKQQAPAGSPATPAVVAPVGTPPPSAPAGVLTH